MIAINSVILSVLVKIILGQVDPCETPNGQNGDCKLINQCPILFSHFQKKHSLSANTMAYLRKSLCGFEGMNPKVCCPIGSFLPPTTQPPSNLIATSDLLPDTKICGSGTYNKIFGGTETLLDEHPWMALLEYRSRKGKVFLGCGGALINKRYVLTARHCLTSTLIRVRLGEYNTETDPDVVKNGISEDRAPPVLKIGIEETILYDNEDFTSDIGLIRLSSDVEFSDFVKPICLPLTKDHLNNSYVGDILTVAGWGLTEEKNRSTVKLQVEVPVKPLSECMKYLKPVLYNVPIELNENHICAGGVAGKDSCKGDSGGPLMGFVRDGNLNPHWYVLGVVSFGPSGPCGQENKPAVYVKVANFLPWIIQNLKP